MNVIAGESSFMGCKLVSCRPRREEDFSDIFVDTECYTNSKDFMNPEITLFRYCSINSEPNSKAEGRGCRESGVQSEQPVLWPCIIFFPVSRVVNTNQALMICSFVMWEKEGEILLTSGGSSWRKVNQPSKGAVCISKRNSLASARGAPSAFVADRRQLENFAVG